MKFPGCSKVAAAGHICLHAKDRVIERIADGFAWWAGIAFDHPYRCIVGTLVFVGLLCIGFIPGIPIWIDGAEPLYSLPYSVARSQGAVHKVLFNETAARQSFIIVTAKNPGENVFTWEHLEDLKLLDRLIRGQTVDPVKGRRVGITRKPEYGLMADTNNRPKKSSDGNLNSNLGSSLDAGPDASDSARHIIEYFNSRNRTRNPTDDRGDAANDILTFQDICLRNSFNECAVTSVLQMGVFDMMELLQMGPNEPPMLFLFDGLVFNTLKKGFPPHYLLGKARDIPCSPELPKALLTLFYEEDRLSEGSAPGFAKTDMLCIKHAEAFQLIYEIRDTTIYQKRNEDWEKVLVDVLQDNMNFRSLRVSMNAYRSRDDALRSSTSESSDVLFVTLTFGLLIAYSTSLNFSCDLYRSKSYPALAGVIAAMLGLLAGMGTMSLCRVAFVPTALVCPFLVVGVGVDDMFVIINAYALSYMVDSARDRCVLALRDTGLAITLTTATSLVSFAVGLNTGYLSIRNFCWFCGAGMLFGYIFVLTFFFAVHCLDARREEENMVCLFCVPTNHRREARRRELVEEGVVFHEKADISTFRLGALMVRRAEHRALRRHALRMKKEGMAAMLTAEPNTGDSQRSTTSATSPHKHTSPASDDNRAGGGLGDGKGDSLMYGTRSPEERKNGKLGGFIRWTEDFQASTVAFFDSLLASVALEGHHVGKERNLEPTPSNGILEFPDDPDYPTTGDPLVDIVHYPDVPLHYISTLTGQKKLFIDEPKGSVGRKWRIFLIRFYGPLLSHPYAKASVLFIFTVLFGVGLYGCTQIKSGLDLRDLAPTGSYLNQFDGAQMEFFSEYDYPVDVFFPEATEWWDVEVQKSLRELQAVMEVSGSGKLVTNPFIRMLDDPELKSRLQSGDQAVFETTLYEALALEGGKYKQFEQNFVWEGARLRAWKMQILPDGMQSSAERALWMTQIRNDCSAHLDHSIPLVVMAWNYMMTFYESDIQITSSVASNMIVAAITMLIVAMIGIPQLLAGGLVCFIMGLIDVWIIGFMFFWGVKLNMVSMICLLISVGFSVDFSAHVCHTFMDAEGETRNQRMIEALVLMGNPVFHGAASSILGMGMLGFSQSYIFKVFFKMMMMVTVFALVHSVLFLPVLLSLVGDARPHHAHKTERVAANKGRPLISIEEATVTEKEPGIDSATKSRQAPQPSLSSQPTQASVPLPVTKTKVSRRPSPRRQRAPNLSPTSPGGSHRHQHRVYLSGGSPTQSSRPVRALFTHQRHEGPSSRRSYSGRSEQPSPPTQTRKTARIRHMMEDEKYRRRTDSSEEENGRERVSSRRTRPMTAQRSSRRRGSTEGRYARRPATSQRSSYGRRLERYEERDFVDSPAGESHRVQGSRRKPRRGRTPNHAGCEESDWSDDDCCIDVVTPYSQASPDVSELVSPPRNWRSPVIQRKKAPAAETGS